MHKVIKPIYFILARLRSIGMHRIAFYGKHSINNFNKVNTGASKDSIKKF